MAGYSPDGKTYITDSGEPIAVIPDTQPMIDALSRSSTPQYGQAPAGAPTSLTEAAAAQPPTFGSSGILAPTDISNLTAPVNTASAFIPPAPDLTGGMSTMPAADGGFGSTLSGPTSSAGVVVEGNGAKAAPAATSTETPDTPQQQYATTTDTVTEGMTGSAQRQWDSVGVDQSAAAKAKSVIDVEKAKEAGLTLIQSNMQRKKFLEREKEIAAQQEQAKIEWDNKIKAADDKYRGANIDSGRLWRDSSTGSKIAAGVGIMLGALGQALTGKDNPALKIIDAAVDRDIDIQKANMEKAGKEAAMTRSAYSTYLEATGSEAAARNQMHILTLENLQGALQAKLASSADAEGAAILQKQLADINAEITDRKTKGSVFRQTTQTAPVVAKPTPAGTSHWNDTVTKDMSARKDVLNAVDKIEKTLDNPERAAEFMGPLDSAVLSAASKFGFEVPADYLEYKTETGALVASILKIMSGAGVSQLEYERWKNLLPTVDKNPANAKAELKAFAARERDAYETARAGYLGNMASPESKAVFSETFPSYGGNPDDKKSKYSFGTPTNP